MLMHELASSKVVPLEDATAQICWRGSREKRMKILSRAMSSLLKSLEEAAKNRFEDKVRGGKIRNFFPMIVSNCCENSVTDDFSAARDEAGKRRACVRCHSTYVYRVRDGKH